jgi:predicted dehydrogenase
MTRRTFAGATLSGALAGTLSAQGPERVRIAFLGVAHSHAEAKVKIVLESSGWELAGIWEPDSALAARYRKRGVRVASKEELLNDPGVRVIAVESEVKRHAELGLAALEAGKHVHLEKPPADNMAEMRRLVDAARSRGLLLQMGYMWRYHPGINAVLEAARKGWLGDIYLVKGMMNTLIDAERRKEWALFHGGQMFEQGCHLIDPLVRLLGRPQKITSFLRNDGKFNDNLFDNTAAVFEFSNAMGIVTSAVLQPNANRHRSFEVFGTNGTAAVRPIEGPPTLVMDLQKAAGPYKAGFHQVPLPPFERYKGDFAELLDCVRTGKPLSVTLDEDLLVQEALLRASDMWG